MLVVSIFMNLVLYIILNMMFFVLPAKVKGSISN